MAEQNSVLDEDVLGSPSSVHAEDSDYHPSNSDASTDEDLDSPSPIHAEDSDKPNSEVSSDNENEGADCSKKRKRYKKSNPETWKQNQAKQKRLRGASYMGISGKEVSAKAMGPPCSSKFCQRASTRQCQDITEEQRQWIFRKVWAMKIWEEGKIYITTLVSKVTIKQRRAVGESRRNATLSYQLKMEDGRSVKVCKALFASTVGFPFRTISDWITNPHINNDEETRPIKSGPKTGKHAKLGNEEKDFLNGWLKDLPTVDSHYCRSSDSYKNKRFLHPGTTIAQLHRLYQEAAAASGVRAAGIQHFSSVFHEQNYSVFIPRKDQCDVCVSFKHGNISKNDYDSHILKKEEARQEKLLDKESANAEKSVWTMDLQAVLLCPETQASSMYYKTKLQVHNFTLFDLRTKEGYCYIWDESQGDLSSEVFACLQYHLRM